MGRQADRDKLELMNEPTKILGLRDACSDDVMHMVAVTLSLIVLNKFKNQQIRHALDLDSKGQYETALRILFVGEPTTNVNKVLKFVGLKRTAAKYRFQLMKRYGCETGLAMDLILK